VVLTVTIVAGNSVIQCSILISKYNPKITLKIFFNMMDLTTSDLSASVITSDTYRLWTN